MRDQENQITTMPSPSISNNHILLPFKYKLLLTFITLFFVLITIEAVLRILKLPTSGDFEHFYYAAYGVVHGQNIYESGFPFTGLHWYAYLPLFAIVLSPLVALGLDLGHAGAVWVVLNAMLLALCLFIAARESITRLGMKATPRLIIGVSFLVVLVLGDKIRSELRMGQSDGFVLIWMMLGLMWLHRRPLLAGFMLGGSVNVKLQGLVFLPYMIFRGRLKNLIGLIGGTLFFALVGSLIWGWNQNTNYLVTMFSWIGDLLGIKMEKLDIASELMPLEWIRNMGFPSVIKRAQLHWEFRESVVMIGVLALICIIVAAGWSIYAFRGVPLFKGRTGRTDDATPQGRGLVGLEWAGLMTGMLAFSPHSTALHFIMSLFVLTLASTILHTQTHRKSKIVVGVMMVVFWASLVLPPGGEQFKPMLVWWRAVGGPMWALLALYLCVLWAGLGIVGELPAGAQKDID